MPTGISYVDETFNPVVGCTKCGPGCLNCYAEKMAYRLACMGQKKYQNVISTDGGVWNNQIFCDESVLDQPRHWRRPRRILCCSMGDLFHPKVPFEFVGKVFEVMCKCQHHRFLVLTKREKRLFDFYKTYGGTKYLEAALHKTGQETPIPNVHLGVTICNQAEADEKIPILLQIPAVHRWVSIEPMLEEINMDRHLRCSYCGYTQLDANTHLDHNICENKNKGKVPSLDWVVVGCESGPNRRECKLEWIRSIVQQCQAAGVKCFVKQVPINGKVSHDPSQWPKDLRVQEM